MYMFQDNLTTMHNNSFQSFLDPQKIHQRNVDIESHGGGPGQRTVEGLDGSNSAFGFSRESCILQCRVDYKFLINRDSTK